MPLKVIRIFKDKQTEKKADEKVEWNEVGNKKWSEQKSAEAETFVEDDVSISVTQAITFFVICIKF